VLAFRTVTYCTENEETPAQTLLGVRDADIIGESLRCRLYMSRLRSACEGKGVRPASRPHDGSTVFEVVLQTPLPQSMKKACNVYEVAVHGSRS